MAEELGTQMQGDPEVGQLNPDDIISVGTERPPETPPTGQEQPPAADGNGQQATEPPAQPDNTQTPPTGTGEETPPTPPPTTTDGTTGGEQPPTGEPQTPPEPVTPPTTVDPWENVLSTLNTAGAQYQDKDQLIADITAAQQYKQNPYGNLPVEVKAHIEFLNSGGNTNEFYRLKSQDFKNMSDREVLFQSYLKDNPDHAANMDFARMDFDRNYAATYGMLDGPKKTIADYTNEDDEVDHAGWDKYNQDFTYWQQKRGVESGIARNKLVAWQEQATTPQNPQTGMTNEEAQNFMQEHQRQVQRVKTTYKGESFPISDNPQENLNLGVSDNIRAQWEQDLANPMPLFNELGLANDGKLDMEKFKRTAFIHRIWPQLGPIVSKLILEQNNRQTVTGQQVNPTPQNPPPATAPPGNAQGDDEMAEAAELFAQQNQLRMRESRGYRG